MPTRAHGLVWEAASGDPAARETAPLLAVWKDSRLSLIDHEGGATGGYGGDIAAAGKHFFVSATRSNQVLAWSPQLGPIAWRSVAGAGALTRAGGALWCGGHQGWLPADGALSFGSSPRPRARLQPDNHALGLDA